MACVKNQKESLKSYEKIVKYYKEYNKDKYAGAFIDEQGELNILITNKKDNSQENINKITGSKKIKFHNAVFSLDKIRNNY